jgi:hypothetical protein
MKSKDLKKNTSNNRESKNVCLLDDYSFDDASLIDGG